MSNSTNSSAPGAMNNSCESPEQGVQLITEADIVAARQKGRALALGIGFSPGDATLIATAISELARNIVTYAKRGEIRLIPIELNGKHGLTVVAKDEGAGIPDIRQALQDGYSTAGRLGLGLPGVKRLMDEMEIISAVGVGTTVTAKKWRM
jgi:serine/threonine-protein kinase RsbT